MNKTTRRAASQPVQVSSLVLADPPHRSSTSSVSDLDCNRMKSLNNF